MLSEFLHLTVNRCRNLRMQGKRKTHRNKCQENFSSQTLVTVSHCDPAFVIPRKNVSCFYVRCSLLSQNYHLFRASSDSAIVNSITNDKIEYELQSLLGKHETKVHMSRGHGDQNNNKNRNPLPGAAAYKREVIKRGPIERL